MTARAEKPAAPAAETNELVIAFAEVALAVAEREAAERARRPARDGAGE